MLPRSVRLGRAIVLLAVLGTGTFALRFWMDARVGQLLRDGQAELAAGHYASGLELARKALWLRPASADAALLAARCLGRLGRDQEADAHFQRAGALALDDQRARAQAWLRQGQFERAVPVLWEVIRLDPHDAEALRILAGIHHTRGEYVIAEELARRLAASPESEIIGQALLGTIHHDLATQRLESPAAAIQAFERVLELDPDLVRCPIQPRRLFWEFLARDLLAEGRPDDARRHLEHALATGEDAGLVELLGQTYASEGQLDQARRCWERARDLDPSRADPWLDLGQLALRQGRLADAVHDLTRAVELAPGSVKPLYNLVQAHRRLGHQQEADRLQRRLDDLNRSPRSESRLTP